MSSSAAAVMRKRLSAFAGTSSGALVQIFSGKILLLISNLATGVLVARTLAPVGRGEQAAMAMWPGLLCGLFTLGVPVALTYRTRRSLERRDEFLWAAILLGAFLGILATLVGIAFIPHWLTRYDSSVVVFAQWMMLLGPFAMLAFIFQASLEGRGDFTTSSVSKTLPQIASLILLGLLAFLHRLTPFSSTLAYFAPIAFVPIVLAWRLRHAIHITMGRFRATAKELLSYGIRSYAIDILGTLSQQVDQVLVVGLLSAAGLGIYAVALSVSRVLAVFHSSLVTVLFPKAASLEPSEVVTLTGRAARISTFVAALAAICMILILPLIMVHLYGRDFSSVVPVARILSIEIVVTGATSIFAQAFMATGRPGIIAILQVIGLALTVPFMLILIPRLGLSGAALALLLSSICRLAMTLACYPIILKTRVPHMIITRSDLSFLWRRVRRTT